MAAVAFAREIGTPVNAHATIHWAGTSIGDVATYCTGTIIDVHGGRSL